MVSGDDTYSFCLSPTGSSRNSPDLSVTSNKIRIDSLFNDQRYERKSAVTVEHTHTTGYKKLSGVSITPIRAATTSPAITTINLSQPKSWESAAPSPKQELENLFGGPDRRHQAFLNVRSAVQAQIERVFADASNEPVVKPIKESPEKKTSIEEPILKSCHIPPPPPLPLPAIPSAKSGMQINSHSITPDRDSPIPSHVVTTKRYDVDYLGAVQLGEKASSLDVLQEPLKDLYYKYRLSIARNRKPVSGEFHIIDEGVKITHGPKKHPGYYELLSPFSSIAVWAAVKLVMRREIGEHGQMFFSYAFLPLICDPVSNEKYNLYHELNVANPNVMEGEHPPMFACVMKKRAVPYMLECHAFVCKSSEDAIVIAANLYQALLEIMKGAHISDTSSDTHDEDMPVGDEFSPIRPPRKRKSPDARTKSGNLQRSSSDERLGRNFLESIEADNQDRYCLKRSSSDRHLIGGLNDQYTGDVISRSHSFGNIENFNHRKFELEQAFLREKAQSGLNSVDDVLKQVVKPRGMSFTEMKPEHRDLLLKLVVTLSKDEIYQRSKNIMRNHKTQTAETESEESTITSVLKATKRSISRLGSRAASAQHNKSTKTFGRKSLTDQYFLREVQRENDIARSIDKKHKSLEQQRKPQTKPYPQTPGLSRHKTPPTNEDFSCSECDYESVCSRKCYCTLPRKVASSIKDRNNAKIEQDLSSSETSDLPCGCGMENCFESEKCYCSLSRVKYNNEDLYENTPSSNGYMNSSSRSNISRQGYLTITRPRASSSSYLTNHSVGSLSIHTSRLSSDGGCRKSLSSNFSSDSENSESNHSSKSSLASGYHSQDSAINACSKLNSSSYEKRVSHHCTTGSISSACSDDSSVSFRGNVSSQKQVEGRNAKNNHAKIILVSAVDPTGKVVYRSASQKQKKTDSDTNSIMSMKKTAEIAALFSGIKLNQTTDLIDEFENKSDSDDASYASLGRSDSILFSNNIENSLGYLP